MTPMGAKIILLDRLVRYGPETEAIRGRMRERSRPASAGVATRSGRGGRGLDAVEQRGRHGGRPGDDPSGSHRDKTIRAIQSHSFQICSGLVIRGAG